MDADVTDNLGYFDRPAALTVSMGAVGFTDRAAFWAIGTERVRFEYSRMVALDGRSRPAGTDPAHLGAPIGFLTPTLAVVDLVLLDTSRAHLAPGEHPAATERAGFHPDPEARLESGLPVLLEIAVLLAAPVVALVSAGSATESLIGPIGLELRLAFLTDVTHR